MAEALEKTCENCEYEHEDVEGTHCRHCIHNAEEHFEPKINHEQEIRNKAIDEFAKSLKTDYVNFDLYYILENNNVEFENASIKSYKDMIDELAEQLKGGATCLMNRK